MVIKPLRAGVVIGHYNCFLGLRLNIAAIRQYNGPRVPILISDDCSDGFAPTPNPNSIFGKVTALAASDPYLFLWPNVSRIGHSGGDGSSVWKGIIWAKNTGLHCFAKLSQRFIITIPNWLQKATHQLMATPFPLMGKACSHHGWKLRTEAMVLKTEAWYRPDVLAHLTPRPFHWAFEDVLWHDVRDRLGGKMLSWDILADARPHRAPGILFREANSPREYRALAAQFKIPWDRGFSCLDSNRMKNYRLG